MPVAPVEGTTATLHTPDGFALAAALYLPDGEDPFPGVVLSHMGGSNKEAWGEVPALLRLAGYAVLNFDFRGHGQSDGALDPPRAATDLGTALAFLRAHPRVDGGQIGLVGASMGGIASIIVGAGDPQVRAVVAISSSPDAAGQYPGQVVGQLSPRPFLAIGCDEDPITKPERVRQLYEAASPPKQVVLLECAAHANDILETQAGPRLIELVLMWLNDHVKAES
jgi:pimeloyl-ACP methyl ester carboxylesterase